MQRQTGQGALGVLSLQLEGSLVGWRSSHGKYGAQGSYSRLWVQEMGHLDQQHQGPRRTPAAHSSPPLLCPAASPDALDSTPLLYQLYLVSLQVSSLSPHMRSLLPVCVPAARVPFQKANLIKLPPSLTPSNSFFLPGGMRFKMLKALRILASALSPASSYIVSCVLCWDNTGVCQEAPCSSLHPNT